MKRSIAVIACTLMSASVVRAETSSHPLVHAQVDACTGASSAEVQRILRIELGALLVDTSRDRNDITRVAVTCQGERVQVRVEDPLTGKSLERVVEAGEAGQDARSRLVSLAIAELVAASWTELETNPQPKVRAAGAVPSEQSVISARRAVKKRLPKQLDPWTGVTRISAVVSRRAFFSEDSAQWGGGVRLGRDEFSTIGWTADVLAEHGSTTVRRGTVSLDTLTLGGSIYAYRRLSVLTFQLGAGVRLGVARLAGQPFANETVRAGSGIAPWGWPTAIAGLRLHPYGPLVIEMSGEVGYVVLPMKGNAGGSTEVTIAGPWVGASLGLGMMI